MSVCRYVRDVVPKKILIADDHAIVREGLGMIIAGCGRNFVVCGEAADGREAIKKAKDLQADVVIMDIGMPILNGIEATGIIIKNRPSSKIIVLTMFHDSEHVYRAIKAGAKAYVLKEAAGRNLINAISAVVAGRVFFGSGVVPIENRLGKRGPVDSLSRREMEVLQLAVEGKSNAKIAEILFLSPKTIETYRCRLMIKLGVDNLADLVKFSLLNKLITLIPPP